MRRLALLLAVFALTLALAFVAGCDKENAVTNPVDDGFGGTVGVPDDLALARSIPPMLANGEETVEILATVVDGKKRGLEGIGVVFTTTQGSVEPFATTDAQGVARTVLTSAALTTDVTATVTAVASADSSGKPAPDGAHVVMSRTPLSGELLEQAITARLHDAADGVMDAAAESVVSDETTVKMLGITLTATATPGTIPADGQSASRIRANLIETTSRIPLQDERVRFGASAGAITGLVTTDDTGTATALLTGTTSGTTSDVTVYYGNQLTASTSVDFSALTLTLVAGVATAQPDGTWETPVAATLVNAEQNPVSGVSVAFTSSSGAIPSPVATDEKGVAATVLYHDADLPQSVTIAASFGELSQQLQIDLDPTLVLALEAGLPVLSPGDVYRTPITARLTNTDNNPLVGAAIRFSAAQGTIPSPVTTNPDGEAVTTLVSSTALESDQVTAEFGLLSEDLTVQFSFPEAAEVFLSADPTTLPADGESRATLTAEVVDATGAPVPDGTQVVFSVVSGGGSIGITTRTTEDGMAETDYTAGSQSGYAVVRAVAGSAQDDSQILLTPLGAGALALSADATSILADGFASTVITALVTDAVGNPVPSGTTVSFTTSRGQLDDPKPTDEEGRATVRLRAARYQTGTARVTAQLGSFSDVVDVKFVSEEAVQIVAKEVDSPHIGIKGSSDRESAVVTFVVMDRNSIPVDEDHAVDLNFALVPVTGTIDATIDPPTARTNYLGQANANVLAGTVAGAVEVQAATGALQSEPIRVVIHGDLPDPEHFSLSFDRINIAGLVYDGIRDPVTARVGDQYGNPVPDSTLVYYTTEFGIIQGSAPTDDHAEATVDLVTAAPRPVIPGGDGLVEVTAQTVSKAGGLITASGHVMWSGHSILEFTDPTPAQGFALDNGGIVTLNFRVRDANNNPLVAGTQIAVTSNDGTLGGQTDITLPDTQDPAYTFFSVTLSDDDPEQDSLRSVTVTVTVTSENGDRVAFLTGTMR